MTMATIIQSWQMQLDGYTSRVLRPDVRTCPPGSSSFAQGA